MILSKYLDKLLSLKNEQGIVNTVSQIFNSIMDKFPIQKVYVFQKNMHSTEIKIDDFYVKRCQSVEDMTPKMFEKLLAFSGEKANSLCEKEGLPPGQYVWLGISSDCLVCVIWSTNKRRRNRYYIPLLSSQTLLKAGMTDPNYRGLGYYTILMSYISNTLLDEGLSNVYVDCIVRNRAAIRCYEKSDFINIGSSWRLAFNGKMFIFYNKCNVGLGLNLMTPGC